MNYQTEAFLWRVWNTFKTVCLPVVLVMVMSRLEGELSISVLASFEFWDSVVVAVITALAGSILTGIDKVHRVNDEIRHAIESTSDEE